MFIKYFKSNSASALIFLPLFALAIWAFGFSSPSTFPLRHAMPFYEMLAGPLSGIPWLATLIGLALVVAEAFLLNYIVNENEVLTKQTYLPAVFYILFMSNNHSMLMLHPLLFSNLFILLAIHKLLSSYRKDIAFSQAFDAGMLLSTATLFYFPCILLLPLLGAAFIIMRPFNWREWFISFLGVIIPYVFVISFYFWNDILDYLFHDKMFYPFVKEKAPTDIPKSFYFMIGIGWTILLFSLFNLLQGVGIGTQKTKKSLILLMWFFFFSALSVLIAPQVSTKYFSAMAIPAAVFCANYFAYIRKGWWAETLFLLLIASIFLNLAL